MDAVMEKFHALHEMESLAPLFTVLIVLGAISLLSLIHDWVRMIWSMFFRSGKNMKKFGSWAIVTGATDGIGKGMVFEFAKKGLNVVLISRTQSKLDDCAKELLEKYPKVDVKVLAIDFAKFDSAGKKKVEGLVRDMDVGVLVNNVGISYPYPQYFNELDDDRVEDLVRLNVDSTVWMTRAVLPGMMTRKRGAIVNMSSAAGVSTSPLLSGYSGAKGFVTAFSKSLNAELKGKGIHVQCQVPLFVATKLAKIRKTSLLVPSPAGYARSAVAAIGYDSVISPYWSHRLEMYVLDALPQFISNRIVFSMHADLRKRGMKKDNKQA